MYDVWETTKKKVIHNLNCCALREGGRTLGGRASTREILDQILGVGPKCFFKFPLLFRKICGVVTHT